MKRLLLILALALLPAALFAQPVDRDVLVATDGTLYTIESRSAADSDIRSLHLTIARGNTSTETIVPDTLTGTNWRPTLTYDSESKTVFVFWICAPNAMSSKLLFASYRDGKWSPTVSFGDQSFHSRDNLRIAITHHVSTLQTDGSYADAPALLVHAVWWETANGVEKARYALFTIESARVADYELHDVGEFADAAMMPFNVAENFNPEILRHPALIQGTNSVDVLFGDTQRMAMHRVTLKPIADTRIHIPVGHHGGRPFAPPQSFSANWTGRISTIASGPNLVMYNTTKDATSFVMFANGEWSDVRTLPLSANFSADAAAAALSRMLASEQ